SQAVPDELQVVVDRPLADLQLLGQPGARPLTWLSIDKPHDAQHAANPLRFFQPGRASLSGIHEASVASLRACGYARFLRMPHFPLAITRRHVPGVIATQPARPIVLGDADED